MINGKNRVIILTVLGVLILLVLTLGVTKAYLQPQTNGGSTSEIRVSTCAKFLFNEKTGTEIKLEKTAPMDKVIALKKVTPYEFSLSSNCNNGSEIGLYLGIINGNENNINSEYIAYSLYLGEKEVATGTLNNTDASSDFTDNEKSEFAERGAGIPTTILNLTKVSVASGQVLDYKLYLWVDSSAGNDVKGTFNAVFMAKSTGEYKEETKAQ